MFLSKGYKEKFFFYQHNFFVRSEIGSLDVGVLINNVAVDLPYKTFDQEHTFENNYTTLPFYLDQVLKKVLSSTI